MKRLIGLLIFAIFLAAAVNIAYGEDAQVMVIGYQGDITIVPDGMTESIKCMRGMRLKPGDDLKTGKDSYLLIAFDELKKNRVKVRENSHVILVMTGADKCELVDGEIVTLLKNMKPGEVFQIKTPSATCGARGTGWFTRTDGRVTEVEVFDGSIFLRGVNRDGSIMREEMVLERGFMTSVRVNERPEPKRKMPKDELNRITREVRIPAALRESDAKEVTDNAVLERDEQAVKAMSDQLDAKIIDRAERVTTKPMESIIPMRGEMMNMRGSAAEMRLDRQIDTIREEDRINREQLPPPPTKDDDNTTR